MAKKKRKSLPRVLGFLKKHFDRDPGELPVVEQRFENYQRPNLHLALEEMMTASKTPVETAGVVSFYDHETVTLSKLARPMSAKHYDLGPVEYVDVELAGENKLACVRQAIFLFRSEKIPVALLISRTRYPESIIVGAMARDRETAEKFLRQLARKTNLGSAYRGHILSLEQDCHRELSIRFHRLPLIKRQDIILPEAVLQRIERHSISFTKHAEKLKAAGRHIKRGVLLYGQAGTGKTLSAMYLAGQMPGRTVMLLTGGSIGSIEAACQIARMLVPATIILEDADLIGTDRQHQIVGANALLFELLNQMEGLSEDADVLFILTTNRPQMLEPALAARPGRIDQAIEVPLPDADCRRRLMAHYGRGLQMDGPDIEGFVRRTEGVSAAFIRELLRKAAVFAAEEDGQGPNLIVRNSHLEESLRELLFAGGAMTRSLLGAAPASGG